MQRVLGTLAAFAGWMSLLASAAAGLLASEVMGLSHTEGPLPPSAVMGFPEVVVLWVLVGAAVLALLPVGAAMVSQRPSRSLYVAAGTMAVAGLLMLPDELGRVHALALIPGAAAFAASGYLLRGAGADAAEPAGAADEATGAVSAPAEAPSAVVVAAAVQPAPAAAVAAPPPQPSAPAPKRPRARRGAVQVCPWCSTEHKAGAATCETCGAALTASPGIADEAIPGVTVVSPELRDYASKVTASAKRKERTSLLAMLMGSEKDDRVIEPSAAFVDDAAFQPPSDDVRREMARLEAEIAAAAAAREMALHGLPSGSFDGPGGPPADTSGPPS
jgi:hypothetical protein